MSTISEPFFSSDGRKIQISFVLTMPVELELELSALPSINYHSIDGKNAFTQSHNNVSTDYIDKDVQSISNELIGQLLKNNDFVSAIEQIKSQKNVASFHERNTDLKGHLNINILPPEADTAIEDSQIKPADYSWGFLR
ncbi:MAG: hypothetical protein KME64_37985 [Scytonematopsis contorta HA4267-MV1]|jgi:hypothetical protein|nr:hypothetical protein [Scytonematopsis contorta HA4267-MV1]